MVREARGGSQACDSPTRRQYPRLMTIHIRSAGPDDASILHALVVALAVYEKAPNAVEATPEDYRRHLSADVVPFECLLAEVDGSPVGFALFFPNYSTWQGRAGLYLEDLFVQPTHRQRGVGRALFQRLAAIAGERGYGRVEWKVLHWNTLALDFYRGLGAHALADWASWRLDGASLRALGRAPTPGVTVSGST